MHSHKKIGVNLATLIHLILIIFEEVFFYLLAGAELASFRSTAKTLGWLEDLGFGIASLIRDWTFAAFINWLFYTIRWHIL